MFNISWVSTMRLVVLTTCAALIFTSALAAEAPLGMTEFNIVCPAKKLQPEFDAAYHDCNNGYENGSCGRFVTLFRELLPGYDCQRSFDSTADKKYVVPAVWLLGDGALEDYVRLLSKLKNTDAIELFASKEFRAVLDGALAEDYAERSRKAEKRLKGK